MSQPQTQKLQPNSKAGRQTANIAAFNRCSRDPGELRVQTSWRSLGRALYPDSSDQLPSTHPRPPIPFSYIQLLQSLASEQPKLFCTGPWKRSRNIKSSCSRPQLTVAKSQGERERCVKFCFQIIISCLCHSFFFFFCPKKKQEKKGQHSCESAHSCTALTRHQTSQIVTQHLLCCSDLLHSSFHVQLLTTSRMNV